MKGTIVRGFYYARVKELGCEIYKRSKRFHSPLDLLAFIEVWISKRIVGREWLRLRVNLHKRENINANILGHGLLLA